MNRRFLDPLFFAFLFALDLVIWLITWLLNVTPEAVAVIAPVFASMAVLGLIRAGFGFEPRRFWSELSLVTLVFLVFMGIAEMLTPNLQSVNLSFSVSVGFMGIALVSSLVALFLAFVGAIAGPQKKELDEQPLESPEPAGTVLPVPEEIDVDTTVTNE